MNYETLGYNRAALAAAAAAGAAATAIVVVAAAATATAAAAAAAIATACYGNHYCTYLGRGGRLIKFDTWLEDLQLYVQSVARDNWLTRNATARLAVRNHLLLDERAHFGQLKTAKELYDAVVTLYSSPSTAALGRLMLSYLFLELSDFHIVADLMTHLRSSDTRYRAALKPAFLMYITLYFLVTNLLDSLCAIRDHFLLLCDAIICIHVYLSPIICSCVACVEWSGRMRSAFKRYKLLKIAMGEEKMPEEGDARDRWIEKSAVMYDLILQSVNNDMFQHIKDLVELDDSGPKAWKLLRDVIQPNTMAAAGNKVSEMQKCTKIISVLNNSWDNLIPTLNTQQDQWTPEWLQQQILQEDFRRHHTCGGAANKTAEGYGAAGGSRGRGGGRGGGHGRGFGRGRGRGALLPVIGVRNAKVMGANEELVGLGNVLLVEGLSANLLSVRRLQKSKAKVTFGPTSCRVKLGKLLLWNLEDKSSCIKDLWQLPIIPWNEKPPATVAAAATAKATAGREETAPTDGALDAVKMEQQPQQPHGEVLAGVDATAPWAKASSGNGDADWETWHERLCHINIPMLQKLVKDGSLKRLEGTAYGGAEPSRAESGGALGVPSRREPLSPQQLREWYSRRCRGAASAGGAARAAGGATGAAAAAGSAAGAGGAARAPGGTAGAAGAAGSAAAAGVAGAAGAAGGAGAARGAPGAGGVAGAGATAGAAGGAGTAGAARGAAGARGADRAAGGAVGAGAAAGGAAGAGGSGAAGGAHGTRGVAGAGAAAGAAGGAGAAGATGGATSAGGAAGAAGGATGAGGAAGAGAPGAAGGAARPRPYYPASPLPGPSPYSGPTRGLTERREPESRPIFPESRSASPVRTVLTGRVSRPRPPPVPGTHSMTLRPSTAPQRVPLPSPPASSLPVGPDPESDSLRAASPAVTRFLATAVTDPLFESTAASALVTKLVDFATACCLDYATSLVAESASASVYPPSVGGECTLGTDVLEDRQEDSECFAAASPHIVSMRLAPEGDPDALTFRARALTQRR
ncbi:unnamed protein product [Closterium sp. NIES-54]